MRYFHVAFAVLLLAPASFAAPRKSAAPSPAATHSLPSEIAAILNRPEFSSAFWGIVVEPLSGGKPLYSLNADSLFLPASNAKVLTTAAALALAGPEHRFHTTVETTGKLDGEGRLAGDLVLVGRGDPNISGRVLPYRLKTERLAPHTQILEEMADQVAHQGVKIVEGDLIGDDTFYAPERYGEGWAEDDLQWIDGAPVSALSFNDNVIFLKIQPGTQAGDKASATLEPPTPYYELENRVLTTSAGPRKIGIHRDHGSHKVVLWGEMPLRDPGYSEALSVEDPAEFAAQVFRGLLEQRGIAIMGKTVARHGERAQFFDQPLAQRLPEVTVGTSQPRVLAEHVSLPLLEDVRVTNKTSQNLHAELDLRLIGQLKGGGGSFEGGSAALQQFLLQAGLKTDQFFLLDGSGLSRRDLITPAAMVQLLVFAARQPWGEALEQSLPVAGLDGSLSERFVHSVANSVVHAKTGTLSHVNALSGYGQTQSGKRFAFSIFCNNHNQRGPQVLGAIDAIVELLVKKGDSAR